MLAGARHPVQVLVVADLQAFHSVQVVLTEKLPGAFYLRRAGDISAACEEPGRNRTDLLLADLRLCGSAGLSTLRGAWPYEPLLILCDEGSAAADFADVADAFVVWSDLRPGLLAKAIPHALAVRRLRSARRSPAEKDELLHLQSDILQNLSDWVTATDLDGVITYVSPSVKPLLGYDPSELIGRRADEVFRRTVTSNEHLEAHLDEAGHLSGEVAYEARDGREVVVSLHTTALEDLRGEIVGLISVAHDITDRKRAERTLEQLNAKLQRKNKRLAELTETAHRFVDNVSHEFRTPLTVIQEFTEILSDRIAGPVNVEQAEYLGIIRSAANDLAEMVNDLLDTSRLKAGTLRVDRRRVTLTETVASVEPLLQRKAEAKQIRIARRIPEDLPDVFADREKVGRILVNLLVNAVKYSPESSTVTIRGRIGCDGDIEVGVSDEGPGLDDEEQRLIFERFQRVGEGATDSTKGFGLGLNIARELAWMNLGRMRVESQPSKGSTFWFTLVPYDWPKILKRYLSRHHPEVDSLSLAAICIRCGEAEDMGSLRRRLVDQGRPMDLVLGNAETGSLIMLGRCSSQPDNWAAKVRARLEQTARDNELPHPQLETEVLGSWICPRQDADVARAVLSALSCDGSGTANRASTGPGEPVSPAPPA